MARRLLIVVHAPSPNTVALRDALLRGATGVGVEGLAVEARSPFDVEPGDVLGAAAVVLATTENLGYMSGALKDFFDRCYYPCLDHSRGMAYALLVRAGHDGTGTCRAVESIATGLGWRRVREPVVCRGAWRESFLAEAEELGAFMAAGLEAAIF